MPDVEIARQLGVCPNSVCAYRARRGIPTFRAPRVVPKQARLTGDQVRATLEAAYGPMKSPSILARKIGVSADCLRSALKNGLTPKRLALWMTPK